MVRVLVAWVSFCWRVPGIVVGERASLEDGRRTADLRAITDARVAEAAVGSLSVEQLSELAQGHYREEAK